MRQKSEAHDTLYLMFKRDSVLSKIIVDKSKEKYLGSFTNNSREAECNFVNSKPCLPWSHMSEECIRELKRGSSRQLIKAGLPKRIWDHCIELQALIRSHTAHSN